VGELVSWSNGLGTSKRPEAVRLPTERDLEGRSRGKGRILNLSLLTAGTSLTADGSPADRSPLDS
jgi:hypothetical protein